MAGEAKSEDYIVTELENIALLVRRKVLDMAYKAKKSHLGGAMSCVEIFVGLYCNEILRFDTKDIGAESRDRLILSKGHGAMTLYAVLNHIGVISDEELSGYHTEGHFLQVHPSMNISKGIEHSGGSLGQGLPLACGIALGLKLKGANNKVYVIHGDGELNEGSVWEAAAFASANNLNNLITIIDCNKLQLDEATDRVMSFHSIADKWHSFGFDVAECDGHNIVELTKIINMQSDKPRAIVAHTVKGKGLSFAENVPAWHFSELTRKMYEQGLLELGGAE